MPDYKKTEELFKAQGVSYLYKKPLGQLDDELFYAKVTNPTTGTFYKVENIATIITVLVFDIAFLD